MSSSHYWEQRYYKEGHIWGNQSSLTARKLIEQFELSATSGQQRILEIGMGYGRDTRYFLEAGHYVLGTEKAFAFDQMPWMHRYLNLNQLNISTNLPHDWNVLRKNFFDAIVSHRTLHLLDKKYVKGYRTIFADCLKDGGLLVLSARDPRDFNPEQMTKIGPNRAVYKNRQDHVIDFWSVQRFRSNFSQEFDILSLEQGTEIESEKNPVPSYFTIMTARRRARTVSEPSQTP